MEQTSNDISDTMTIASWLPAGNDTRTTSRPPCRNPRERARRSPHPSSTAMGPASHHSQKLSHLGPGLQAPRCPQASPSRGSWEHSHPP